VREFTSSLSQSRRVASRPDMGALQTLCGDFGERGRERHLTAMHCECYKKGYSADTGPPSQN
jgi:hypothetical protein